MSARLSLSNRLRQEARRLAVHVAEDIRNGNLSDARRRLRRDVSADIAMMAVANLFDSIDIPKGDVSRFVDSLADF